MPLIYRNYNIYPFHFFEIIYFWIGIAQIFFKSNLLKYHFNLFEKNFRIVFWKFIFELF